MTGWLARSRASGALAVPTGPAAGPVLVTGATGFLGSSLVRRLLRDGARVRVLVAPAGKAAWLARAGAEVITGDITDRAAVHAAVSGADVMITWPAWFEPEKSRLGIPATT